MSRAGLAAAAAAAVAAVALTAAPARAEDAIVKGAIVKVEFREIYVNLGDGQGVAGGAPIRIKRPIKLQHPVTHVMVEDWVPVGSATIAQAGAALSRAVVGDLVTEIRVGDLAEVLVSRPDARPAAPTPTPTPVPPPPAPRADPATLEVLGVFAAQTGQSLDARIAAWERYLSTHAGSPYEASIRADVEALQALREQMRPASAMPGAEPIESVAHSVPAATEEGAAFPVVFVLERPEHVASAYLHYRTRDRRTYRRALLVLFVLRGSLLAALTFDCLAPWAALAAPAFAVIDFLTLPTLMRGGRASRASGAGCPGLAHHTGMLVGTALATTSWGFGQGFYALFLIGGALNLACAYAFATPRRFRMHTPYSASTALAAGSTIDIIGRIVLDPLSRALGQTIVVENKAGAGGTIGSFDALIKREIASNLAVSL